MKTRSNATPIKEAPTDSVAIPNTTDKDGIRMLRSLRSRIRGIALPSVGIIRDLADEKMTDWAGEDFQFRSIKIVILQLTTRRPHL
jgi:hypothetical protein